MMCTRLLAKPFLFVTACLLIAGLGAGSELKAAPVYRSSDTVLTGQVHELYPRMLPGLPDTLDFEWSETPFTDTVPDSQGSLQGAILVTLLFGGMLRFLISDTLRQFAHETFNPLNWNSYQ